MPYSVSNIDPEDAMSILNPLGADPSTSDRVYLRLKEAIASAALRPGESVVEAEVARQLGVSTTPVREALQRLGQEGLVVLNRFRGATVVELTDVDVREIYELREALEPLAAKSAVPLLTSEDLAAMREAIDRAAMAIGVGDWQELSQWNRRFHATFIDRCPNLRLRRTLATLQVQNRIIAVVTWQGRGYDNKEHTEHEAILEAAALGDADEAADRLRRHIARFGAAVIEIWAGRLAPSMGGG
ncbi:MAG: hypothetical protein QOG89_1912 [Thermomicrobiales bacterium]|jgi:DNA-binding GntR family transcriptional regulator|nr:hypothetical protein [Thermomicrobiales bacterium]